MVTLPLVLPPLAGELLVRGEDGIPARIRHQVTHNGRLDVNGFHRSMNRVAPSDDGARDGYLLADFERADLGFGEGE